MANTVISLDTSLDVIEKQRELVTEGLLELMECTLGLRKP